MHTQHTCFGSTIHSTFLVFSILLTFLFSIYVCVCYTAYFLVHFLIFHLWTAAAPSFLKVMSRCHCTVPCHWRKRISCLKALHMLIFPMKNANQEATLKKPCFFFFFELPFYKCFMFMCWRLYSFFYPLQYALKLV